MPVSMFPLSVPFFVKHLSGLAGSLKKAQALYAEKKCDEATLLHYRLYPDMFSFAKQVQAACDHAKGCAALLAGIEAPKFEDNEKSLADLIARVEKTNAFLGTIGADKIDGTEDKTIIVKMRDREQSYKGLDLLLKRSLPNFFFHCATAHDILRHNGVEIGKRDFMGN
jgi:uncharacterized protein